MADLGQKYCGYFKETLLAQLSSEQTELSSPGAA